MLRSSLMVAVSALMLGVLVNVPASAGGYESPIVRYRPSYDPDVQAIPAPMLSPAWNYAAAYYGRPRGPKYNHFIGGARHRGWSWWHLR